MIISEFPAGDFTREGEGEADDKRTCASRPNQNANIFSCPTVCFGAVKGARSRSKQWLALWTATPGLHMAPPPATLAEQVIGFANSPPVWDQVQTTALELANALRSKGPGISTNSISHFLNIVPLTQDHITDDIHTTLGQTDLPTALTKLLTAASETSSTSGDIPSDSAAPATFEVLRVAANVVMDHGMFVCISV